MERAFDAASGQGGPQKRKRARQALHSKKKAKRAPGRFKKYASALGIAAHTSSGERPGMTTRLHPPQHISAFSVPAPLMSSREKILCSARISPSSSSGTTSNSVLRLA